MDHRPSNRGQLVAEPTSYESPTSESALTEAQMVGVPQPGEEILGGKYEVERVIGVGGMGVVVSALHKKLGQRVAIKFLSRQMQTPELVDRFIREGQACARIKSEHIASVLDVGVLDNGTPYLMMEYLEGIDLDDYIGEHGAIPVDDAVNFVLQACDALAVAHSAGIVHRDLKPSNLFVTQRSDGSPLIKVLDFGIAKLGQSTTNPNPKATLTRSGTMLGSPRYVSPEQLRNASNVDHRADIWAIGIVLHELLVGEPPFVADTFADLCAMITTQKPTPLRELIPDAPEALEAAILRCVDKNIETRFQTVAELADALAPVASEESRALALRVGKILEVASSRTGGSIRPRSDGTTPRRYGRSPSVDSRPGRMAPTLSRGSGAPRVSSASSPSAISISSPTLGKKWPARLGALALLLVLSSAIVAIVFFVRRSQLATSRSATTAVQVTAPPQAQPTLPPPVTAPPVPPEPPVEPPPSASETSSLPVTPPAPLKPKAKGPPKPKSAPSAPPAVTPAAPSAPAQPTESDMLNRRR